jgi:hypothetical protein
MLGLNGVGMAPVGMTALAIQTVTQPGTPPISITVPASRTAVFVSRSRVVVFGAEKTGSLPGFGPYYKNRKWYCDKVAGDQCYYVADVTKDLSDSATTARSVSALASGVTVLEVPTIQGNLIVIKLGGFDRTIADNYCTLRVTCDNGEVFDRTIHFNELIDKTKAFDKDADDQRYYAIDLTSDLTYSSTSIASVQAPVVTGVSALSDPVVQGQRVIFKLGGFNQSDGAINSYALPVLCTNGELFVRTIYFNLADN